MRCPRYTLDDAVRVGSKVRLPRGVTPAMLLVGIRVEREHADVFGRCDLLGFAKIAAAHFREDRSYYKKLLPRVEAKPYREER